MSYYTDADTRTFGWSFKCEFANITRDIITYDSHPFLPTANYHHADPEKYLFMKEESNLNSCSNCLSAKQTFLDSRRADRATSDVSTRLEQDIAFRVWTYETLIQCSRLFTILAVIAATVRLITANTQ